MSKEIVAEKDKFDRLLRKMLVTPPLKRADIQAKKRKAKLKRPAR